VLSLVEAGHLEARLIRKPDIEWAKMRLEIKKARIDPAQISDFEEAHGYYQPRLTYPGMLALFARSSLWAYWRDDKDEPPVQMGATWNDPVTVLGHRKDLDYNQWKLIKALVGAGQDGLEKDKLEAVLPSARDQLKRLRQDPDWGQVISMPGKKGNGGYRIIV
jgi:hypothetical protein